MIVAGFGFRRDATAASLEAALALATDGRPAIDALAVPHDKAAHIAAFAAATGLPVLSVSAAALSSAATITHSPASLAARGTGSVAEAAALAAAGPGAHLLGPRRISPDRLATCAIAQGYRP